MKNDLTFLILADIHGNSKAVRSILAEIKKNKYGKDAAIIGEVSEEFSGKVYVETRVKGKRLLPLLVDDQLPRIC